MKFVLPPNSPVMDVARVRMDLLACCPVCGRTTFVFVPARTEGGKRFWCEDCYRRDAPALCVDGFDEEYTTVGVDAVARHLLLGVRRSLQAGAAELENVRRPQERRALKRRLQELLEDHEALLSLAAEHGWTMPEPDWQVPPEVLTLARLSPVRPARRGDSLWESAMAGLGSADDAPGDGAAPGGGPAAAGREDDLLSLPYGEILELHFLLEGKWPVERSARLVSLPAHPREADFRGMLRLLREKVDPLYAQAVRLHPASPGARSLPLRVNAQERWLVEHLALTLERIVAAGDAIGGAAREEVLAGLRRIAARFAGGRMPGHLAPEVRESLARTVARLREVQRELGRNEPGGGTLLGMVERMGLIELPPGGRERFAALAARMRALQAELASLDAWARLQGFEPAREGGA